MDSAAQELPRGWRLWALVPLLLAGGNGSMHAELSGVAHQVELALRVDDAVAVRLTGSLLWTHFGVSGPVALNMSRHWLRARLEGRVAALTANVCPGLTFEQIDDWWTGGTGGRPQTALVLTALSTKLPASVAAAVAAAGSLTLLGRAGAAISSPPAGAADPARAQGREAPAPPLGAGGRVQDCLRVRSVRL